MAARFRTIGVRSKLDGRRTGQLFTSTNRSNLPMRRLCDRLGFQRSGVVENLDNDDPELVYYKRLEVGP